MTLVAVSDQCRRVIREARQKLGISQGSLERTARLGKTYVWYVESGKTKNTDTGQLTRLLKTLQKQAEKAQVPAKLKADLAKVLEGIEKQKPKRK